MRTWGRLAALAGCIVASQLALSLTLRSMIIAALFLAVLFGAVAYWHRSSTASAGPTARIERLVVPLTLCWLAISFLPSMKFNRKIPSAGNPELDGESLLHVVVFTATGLVAIGIIRVLEPTLRRARPPTALMLFPIWMAVSGLWASAMLYATVRGGQLGATALLGWATIALGRARPDLGRQALEAYLRWFVRIALVLVVYGHVELYPIWTIGAETARFTWRGAHPLTSSFVLSVAIVIAATTSHHVLRVPRAAKWALVLVFALATSANHSRHALFALALCAAIGLLVRARRKPMITRLGLPLIGASFVASSLFSWGIYDFILRGRSEDSFWSGNSRLDLWGAGIESLRTPFDWVFGHGYGITRTLFLDAGFSWGTEADGSFLAALVSTGIVGLAALIAALAFGAFELVRHRAWRSDLGLTTTLIGITVLAKALVNDSLMWPTLTSALAILVAASAAFASSTTSMSEPTAPRVVARRPTTITASEE